MLMRFFSKFKRDEHIEDSDLEAGPRSFHCFQFGEVEVILIGEAHINMTNETVMQYVDVMDQFIAKRNKVTIYLETDNAKKEKVPDDAVSFIGCINNLAASEKLTIIDCDERKCDLGMVEFYCFLDAISKIDRQITKLVKEKKIKRPVDEILFQLPEFNTQIHMLANIFNEHKFKYADLCELFSLQLNALDELATKYKELDPHLWRYLADCILDVNDGLGMANELANEYLALGYTDEDIDTRSLNDICLDIMTRKQSLQPAKEWLYLFVHYFDRSLNATTICKLVNEIKNEEAINKTILVITGDDHTISMSEYLKTLCKPTSSIAAVKNDGVISPEMLTHLLNDKIDNKPQQQQRCMLM